MPGSRLFEKAEFDPQAPVLGRIGSLETRLARSKAEVRAAQQLRYQVFYEEMSASADIPTRLLRRDKDGYDRYCDHLLVIDTSEKPHKIVGTYRLLQQDQARHAGQFYTQSEFDLGPLLQNNSSARFLELGRSCILPPFRKKRTMELLWHGTWSYALANKIDIMFGCASFEGKDSSAFEAAFSWLGNNAVLNGEENCPVVGAGAIKLDRFESGGTNDRQALAAMPSILKGYLRLGAKVGSEAIIDRQFGTIDVLVVVKVADINPRYLAHFGADASRFAA